MSDGRKYYCFCEANCKFETMTKEQILAAIAQAAETGLVFDADAAFITKVKEGNAGNNLTFWMGTQAQYNALVLKGEKDPKCFYILTDCDAPAELTQKVKDLQNRLDSLTAADVGAAPAGFGLGTDVKFLDDTSVDTIAETGFYLGGTGLPDPLGNSLILHLNHQVWSQQLAFTLKDTSGYGNLCVRREKNSGVWDEWEWEKPPLFTGVEYRTTERCNGKPVYVKKVDCGVFAVGTKITWIEGALSGIVRAEASIADIVPLTIGYCHGDIRQGVCVYRNEIEMYGEAPGFINNLYVTIHYTKG